MSFSRNIGVPLGAGLMQRVRLRFKRTGPARFLSHLHQIDAIRRSLDAVQWPLSKSQGKKPRPKIAFGPAISVGYESFAEYCDVDFDKRIDLLKAKDDLKPFLTEGFDLLSAKSIPRFFPSLDVTVNAANYDVNAPGLGGTKAQWEEFSKKEQFVVTKKKGDGDVLIDARSLVRSWQLDGDRLALALRFGPGKTLKPERILQAVCQWPEERCDASRPDSSLRIARTQLFFEKQNGELVEP